MIIRSNPYYKILMVILISLVFKAEVYANETWIITLEDAIRIGLKNNKAFLLRSEEMRISALNSYLDRKGEYTRPSVDLRGSISKEKELKVRALQRFLFSKTGAIISLENSYSLLKGREGVTPYTTISINLSQPLSPKEVLVNRRFLRDIEDDYNLSLRRLKSEKENFVSKIIESYINLIKQEVSIERSRERIKTMEELLLIANLRYKAGEIPKIDIVDMELQNKLERINILTAEDNYRKSKREFLKLLGILDKEDNFMISKTIKPFLDKLPSLNEALVKAIDYQLFEPRFSFKRKKESLKEERLSKNLSVFLEANYSIQLPLYPLRERKNEAQVGIKMEYKIWDNRRHKRNILQLQKQLEIEEHNLKELTEKTTNEIQEIYKQIDLIKQKREILAGIEEIAQSLLEAGKLKFKMGKISQTELNNIIQRYNKAHEERVNMEIESFLIGVRLLTLTGELASFFENKSN